MRFRRREVGVLVSALVFGIALIAGTVAASAVTLHRAPQDHVRLSRWSPSTALTRRYIAVRLSWVVITPDSETTKYGTFYIDANNTKLRVGNADGTSVTTVSRRTFVNTLKKHPTYAWALKDYYWKTVDDRRLKILTYAAIGPWE